MEKIKLFWRRIVAVPALFSSEEKQLRMFWKMLKAHMTRAQYKFGAYETEKTLRARFQTEGDYTTEIDYYLDKNRIYLNCEFTGYDDEADVGNIFILAQHFNNVIRHDGIVHVDTRTQTCSLHFDVDFRPYLFRQADLDDLIGRHFVILMDVQNSFYRLLVEGEEPAIIFADLIANNKEGGNETE